jgi:chaperone required for assembly of F1-ATPase
MSKPMEGNQTGSAVEAVRRAVGPARARRFYKAVTVAAGEGGYALELDGKRVRTPGRRLLAAPVQDLAGALAAEWASQGEHIEPASMPLTRLANTIIDGVTASREEVAAEIRKYLASDLLFYRADRPAGLRARQAQLWDPILAWARDTLGAHFKLASGVVHVAQSAAALNAAGAVLPRDEWGLGAVHAATTLTGSALIALALLNGAVTIEQGWQAAHVDEDWNMDEWGRDEIALQRRASRFAEFQAAALVLRTLPNR